MADTVKVVVSHNQEIDGKEHKAGDKVSIDHALARVLVARGGVQFDSAKDAEKAQPVPADAKGAGK